MAHVLIACSPFHGHLAPLLRIAESLTGRGHEVTTLTGARFETVVRATGAQHVALPPTCDFDDRALDEAFPGRAETKGRARINFDVRRVFADAIPAQSRALRQSIAEGAADVVVVDPGFFGVLPLLLDRQTPRPPVATVNILPLALTSRDTAPFGFGLQPPRSRLGRMKNALLGAVIHRLALRPSVTHVNEVLSSVGSPALPVFVFDHVALTDVLIQPTVASFEYPRSDLAIDVRFVGPILPPATTTFDPPEWWPELDTARPVVHVSQGTVDTAQLGRLIAPTLAALADEDVLVVVSTGGRPLSAIPGQLPANARVAEFLPYDHFLDKVDVMVTNGGYGGVHYALSRGVPLVVAGATEDKPEVAARVAWSGTGIDLRSGTPKPERIRTAVREVLANPSYRRRAQSLATEFSLHDAPSEVADVLEELSRSNDATPIRSTR